MQIDSPRTFITVSSFKIRNLDLSQLKLRWVRKLSSTVRHRSLLRSSAGILVRSMTFAAPSGHPDNEKESHP